MGGSPLPHSLFNFRDIGGYPTAEGRVRRGRLWRSSAMTALGDAGRAMIGDAGITHAFDLREPGEAAPEPPDLDGTGVGVTALPVIGGALEPHEHSIPAFFYGVLARRGERLAEVVSALSRPASQPAVFFCSTGKDRTGIVAALVLSAVGVSEQRLPASAVEQAMARGERLGIPGATTAQNMGAPRAMMLEILAELRASYGGATAFLLDHGLPEADLRALRQGLVEP